MTFFEIKKKVEECALRFGRNPNSIRMVVASKYFSLVQILELYKVGVRDFGENKVQDALNKMEQLPLDIRWHFLGHLQSNKLSKVIDRFHLIHSIDSFSLAQKLSIKSNKPQKVLFQIKTSGELTKTGFEEKEFRMVFEKLSQLPHLEICGLMTVAPNHATDEETQKAFATLSLLKEEFGSSNWELSMGMSEDYPIAIAQGATLLRIGRALLPKDQENCVH